MASHKHLPDQQPLRLTVSARALDDLDSGTPQQVADIVRTHLGEIVISVVGSDAVGVPDKVKNFCTFLGRIRLREQSGDGLVRADFDASEGLVVTVAPLPSLR